MSKLRNGPVTYCLLACHLIILLAAFIAPYSPVEQFRNESFAPPSVVHFVDAAGHFHWRPFIWAAEEKNSMAPLYFLQPGKPYKFLSFIPLSSHLFGVPAPVHIFLFGSDAYGRDLFSRFLYGGQISMVVGLLATFLSLAIGAVSGLLAGFYGGWLDNLIMRATELFLALPWVYLLLGLRAFLPLSVRPEQILFLLAAIIGILGWARPARLVRGIVMSARSLPYVTAAQQFGASGTYLMRRHLLPETYAVLLAQAALLVPQFIAAEVSLSFLGLGASEPLPSWGSLLGAMREVSVLASYWWLSIPALALVPLFFCYQLFAQGLQNATVRRG